jgi:hypothetical protein
LKKIIFAFALIAINISAFSQGIDYSGSWGQIGFAYSDADDSFHVDYNVIDLNWTETFTGLGIGVKLFEVCFDEMDAQSDYFFSFLPLTVHPMCLNLMTTAISTSVFVIR